MKETRNQSGKNEKIEVESKLSAVSSNPKKSVALLGVLIIALIYVVYSFVWKGEKVTPKIEPEVSKNIITEETPKLNSNMNNVSAPVLPEPPEITVPEAPPSPAPEAPPAPLQVVEDLPPPAPVMEAEDIAMPVVAPVKAPSSDLSERRRSSIMKQGGSGSSTSDNSEKQKGGADQNGPTGYVAPFSPNFIPSKTSFNQQAVTTVGNMKYVIAQGKLIDAVLESAINTEFPGVIRAIVSRDVYSETDKNVLIPKGSRLIGNFASDGGAGKIRVAIGWTRVIRPDGLDINVDSPAVDNLGHSALRAEVDSKMADQLTSALVTMIIKIGAAKASEKALKLDPNAKVDQSTTTNPSTGAVTTSTSAKPGTLVSQSIQSDISKTLEDVNKQSVDVKPVLYIHQGTQIKVFVNRDLLFSQSSVYKKSSQ